MCNILQVGRMQDGRVWSCSLLRCACRNLADHLNVFNSAIVGWLLEHTFSRSVSPFYTTLCWEGEMFCRSSCKTWSCKTNKGAAEEEAGTTAVQLQPPLRLGLRFIVQRLLRKLRILILYACLCNKQDIFLKIFPLALYESEVKTFWAPPGGGPQDR